VKLVTNFHVYLRCKTKILAYFFYIGYRVVMEIHRWIIAINHYSFCILESLLQHVAA